LPEPKTPAGKSTPGGRLLLWAILLATALLAGRWYRDTYPDTGSSRFLGSAGDYWTKPFFALGSASISPAFLVKALAFLALITFFSHASRVFLRKRILTHMDIGEGQRFAAERVFSYIVVVIGIFVGLETLGIDLKSLAVLGGAIGIGIGLGLQNIANNFISGIVLLIERPIQVGDRIEVGQLSGDVVRIASRSTWIRTNDNIVIIVPNADFMSNHVVNWTANDQRVRLSVSVGVSYDSDPQKVRDILLGVAAASPDVLKGPSPDVWFTSFGESWLEFELRVWTTVKTHQPGVLKSDLRYSIFTALKEAGIDIPLPQRVLRWSDRPPASTNATINR